MHDISVNTASNLKTPTDTDTDINTMQKLEIYNTLTKQKEMFTPIVPKQIGLYVCGPTVYDYCHIGHGRLYLIMDTVVRYLRYQGYQVKYVRNITDIDDKIIKRAQENEESFDVLANRFIVAMHEDLKALNVLPPDVEPKATDYVTAMQEMIQTLIDKGYAYVAPNNDVYYHVTRFKSYGCLAHRDLEDLQAGARVEVNEQKQSPLDFVLWKSAKPGEPKWASNWGDGRPGWHIECSAMSLKNLGETFDIHGGGPDLKFPHHENERAQSEAASGKRFVNTWMHIGFLQIDKEKMSKSLGNFLTIRDFLKGYHPEILRYFSLASHYRSPVEYSDESIAIAMAALERMYIALRDIKEALKVNKTADLFAEPITVEPALQKLLQDYEQRFIDAMNDDFNTPIAFSVLFDLVREMNRERQPNLPQAKMMADLLVKLGNILGVLWDEPEQFLQGAKHNDLDKEKIETLIQKRNDARKNKNWALSDEIRQELSALGIVLEDTSQGTLWRKESSEMKES